MINLLKKLVLLNTLLITNAYAATPLWTIQPLTPTSISISPGQTASVQYNVTNQSIKNHVLILRATNGVSQIITSPSSCGSSFTLGSKQSCVLTLQINGSDLTGSVVGGPVICEQRDPLQCYQPSTDNQLRITYVGQSTVARFAYVTQGYSAGVQVCVVNPNDGTLSGCVDAGGGSLITNANPQGIVIDGAGRNAYITAGYTGLPEVYQCAIDQTTRLFSSCSATTVTTPSGYLPYYGLLAINNTSTLTYLVDYNSGLTNRILACPISNGIIGGNCTDTGASGLTDDNSGIILNSANTVAYMGGYGNNYVTVCSVSGSTFSSCINKTGGGGNTFSEPVGVALNNAGTILYVADNGFHGVYACDTTPNLTSQFNNCTIATTLPIQPWSVTINKANTYAYLADYGSTVYTCPILSDTTFGTCVANTVMPEAVDVALSY